jgi:hypothetical protein
MYVLLGNTQLHLVLVHAQTVSPVSTLRPRGQPWQLCVQDVLPIQIRQLRAQCFPPAIATSVTVDLMEVRVMYVLLGNTQLQPETRYAQTVSPANTLRSRGQPWQPCVRAVVLVYTL